ncbi:MAG: DNA-binding NarL/FixJ family response regulator [Crocinitomix sp.]|jgi:DNA-binding NarL/FixJ family response regulator
MIKIAIAEDNSFLANSLINKLGLFADFKIKFHSLDGNDLVQKIARDANIDVVLMDIQMPNMDGIEATRIINRKYPHIKIIMLTIFDSEQHIYESIQAGASGYLMKESSPKEIFDSIKAILSGGAPMSPSIALKAVKIIRNPQLVEQESVDFKLTDREITVLKQLCKGLNYNEIAANLIISPNTVRRHIENIYKKLEVHNKAEAVEIAYRHQLV